MSHPLTVNASPPPPLVLSISFKKVQKMRTVLKRGIAGKALCNEACTVRFQIQLPRKTAKKLHIAARFVTIGKLTKRLTANRRTTVRIKLSRKARKRLAHVRKIKVRLTARATDTAGNRSKTLTRTITLKR